MDFRGMSRSSLSAITIAVIAESCESFCRKKGNAKQVDDVDGLEF